MFVVLIVIALSYSGVRASGKQRPVHTDTEVLKFWKDEFPNMNYKNSFDGVAPIANKLGAFLSHPQIRKAVCEPEKPLRFRKLIDDGTPLIANLSKGKLGSDISNVLGRLIVSMISSAALSRSDVAEQRRKPYFIYIDEFHSFTTEAFAGMLSELRKYGVGLVLAYQYTSQLEPKVLEGILGNVGTLIVFRVGAKDAPLLSKQLGTLSTKPEYLKLSDLTKLPKLHTFDGQWRTKPSIFFKDNLLKPHKPTRANQKVARYANLKFNLTTSITY